ncbi:MAG: hypothetical protein PHN55_09670 [Dysgonamonadaceae bacterium]|nr:hypothetical protein [Dysgonamonadaceae bacterium]
MKEKNDIKITPLLFLEDERLLGYKNGYIYTINSRTFETIEKCLICKSFKERFLYRFSLIRRLLRLGVRTVIQSDSETVLIFINKRIYEFNILDKTISAGYSPEKGVRALYFSKIDSIDGFNDSIVFGGYLSNPEKKQVHIYKRVGIDAWGVIFTFSGGEINHIHNIIPDTYNQCVWILTGDSDDSAAIWRATDNFKKVERILSNNQIYRGCIGFPTEQGLLYATDAPYFDNSIRLLHNKDEKWISDKIFDIPGSSIYGCAFNDKYVFSTTVEPDGRDSSLFKLLFFQERGVGIKDNYTHICIGNTKDGFKDIYKLEKDYWPFIFQFGTIRFPVGDNPTSYLIFEPIATKKYNLNFLKLKIE